MKRIYLILLLLVPLISSAQEHLLGKSIEEVRAAQKAANCQFIRTKITKLVMYDKFKCDDDAEISCFYWKDTCFKVSEALDISLIGTVVQKLDARAKSIRVNQWVDKDGTVKISLLKYMDDDKFYVYYVNIKKYKQKVRSTIGY
jgi:hypothetical protein